MKIFESSKKSSAGCTFSVLVDSAEPAEIMFRLEDEWGRLTAKDAAALISMLTDALEMSRTATAALADVISAGLVRCEAMLCER